MANRIHLKHTKSSATTATTQGVTIPRLPSSGDLLHGEIAINYRDRYEGLFIKNSSNNIVSFLTNGQSIDATKPEGLINGQIGVDDNNIISFYIYNERRNTWQPLSTNHVGDESALSEIPTVQDPQIAYVDSTGLVYISQYDYTTSAQTWVPMATLVPETKQLAHGQETRVVINGFSTEVSITENALIYNTASNKLQQYGTIPEGEIAPELLETYTPSKNVIYYNRTKDKFFIWNGRAMIEIGRDDIPIFSANTNQQTILYNLTTTANTASDSNGSIVLGHNNSVSGANMVTIAGVGNIVNPGGDYSFVEGYQNEASGLVAHAEGGSNKAYGNYSHAEGNLTQANGESSHAEGQKTSAQGVASHVEGSGARASGYSSHAEGESTSAIGQSSHAEGQHTSAINNASHAEGTATSAQGEGSHAEGVSTNASGYASHAEGYNNIASGENSHVGGRRSLAAGRDSFAHGYANSAYCAMSVAMGSGNIVGEPGDANSAVAASSVALGRANSAMGYASFACGHYNYTKGMYTNAIGESTSALNVASHSEGFLSTASAMASHAEGAILPTQLYLYESDDTNYDAMVASPPEDFTAYTGSFLLLNGTLYEISEATILSDLVGYLKVESNNEKLQTAVSGHTDANPISAQYFNPNETGTIANGMGSHSEGFSTYSEGQASHSEGRATSGFGDFSHAEGSLTRASGMSSHAEGHNTHANGTYSHAEGNQTYANGNNSHAGGNLTHANGINSYAGGNSTSAIGNASYALGSGTVTNNAAEFACGKYNVSATGSGTTMFSVGIGSRNNGKNAFEVRADGKIYFYDNNGNQVCLQDIIAQIVNNG